MDPFSYLSVLVSIILGLGITQLLTGLGRLLGARARVRWYWPAVAWIGLLLVVHVQAWWAMFELRAHAGWTFLTFLVVLLLPILLYLAAALLLPEVPHSGPVDLRAHYFAHAGWFFGLVILVVGASFARPLALGDQLEADADHAIQAVFLLGAAAAAVTRRDRYHELLAAAFAVLLSVYVTVLFGRLA